MVLELIIALGVHLGVGFSLRRAAVRTLRVCNKEKGYWFLLLSDILLNGRLKDKCCEGHGNDYHDLDQYNEDDLFLKFVIGTIANFIYPILILLRLPFALMRSGIIRPLIKLNQAKEEADELRADELKISAMSPAQRHCHELILVKNRVEKYRETIIDSSDNVYASITKDIDKLHGDLHRIVNVFANIAKDQPEDSVDSVIYLSAIRNRDRVVKYRAEVMANRDILISFLDHVLNQIKNELPEAERYKQIEEERLEAIKLLSTVDDTVKEISKKLQGYFQSKVLETMNMIDRIMDDVTSKKLLSGAVTSMSANFSFQQQQKLDINESLADYMTTSSLNLNEINKKINEAELQLKLISAD